MVSFSSVLIEFIDPLLDGKEDKYEFLSKVKVGAIAWNVSVARDNKLNLDDFFKDMMAKKLPPSTQIKGILEFLTVRKQMMFSQYQQFIFSVETRKKPDGSISLCVESGPADKFNDELVLFGMMAKFSLDL